MRKINAEIIADSVDARGNRITSFILTYPRFIHSELMTHRMFSRNSASSRAIPFEKMLQMVNDDPFIPIAWQKDHKGMQGTEYIDPRTNSHCSPISDWLEARDSAMQSALDLNEDYITKQLCNRLLEPFMWHTVLVTATEFENFFELRCPKYKLFGLAQDYARSMKDWLSTMCFSSAIHPTNYPKDYYDWQKINHSQAEIHIQALAESIWDAYNESQPKLLQPEKWHIPFGDNIMMSILDQHEIAEKFPDIKSLEELKLRIAVARCARLSYMTFDGEIDYEKDIKLFNQLLQNKHNSPFEHVTRCMTDLEYYSFVKGKYPTHEDKWGIYNYEHYPFIYKDVFGDDRDKVGINKDNRNIYGWCNNFRGFIPYRYLIENVETIRN